MEKKKWSKKTFMPIRKVEKIDISNCEISINVTE